VTTVIGLGILRKLVGDFMVVLLEVTWVAQVEELGLGSIILT
jgi:hypothetical protein